MNIKRISGLIIITLLLFILPSLFALGGSKDLVASLALLPGLADSPDKGAFVDLVKAMDEVYTEGKIKIEVYPFARSIHNVLNGKADFHVPSMRVPHIPESKLPYRYVKEEMGTVYFVIYSHIEKKITRKMLNNALAKKARFPYSIDGGAGIESSYPFPVNSSNDLTQSFNKLQARRIDAIVWAQEEADATLRDLKFKTIYREQWDGYDDVIVISKEQEGQRMNKILSELLIKLKKSGRMEKIYSKVHGPYSNWQPSKMNW